MKRTLLLLLGCVIYFVNLKPICDCRDVVCVQPTACAAGYRLDKCGCCYVCAKSEGELCGGLHHTQGECAPRYQCVVRHTRNYLNRMRQKVKELIGRCEHEKCTFLRCPFGQSCLFRDGIARCGCPKCPNMLNEPVCGERNNRNYDNECALRQEECKSGKEIGLVRGTCLDHNVSRIICEDTSMKIEILKSYLRTQNNETFSLYEGSCTAMENKTHYIFATNLGECGTKVAYTLTSVVYSNVIRRVTERHSPIVRMRNVRVSFQCDYLLTNQNGIHVYAEGDFGDERIVEKMSANSVTLRVTNNIRKQRSANDNKHFVSVDSGKRYVVEFRAINPHELKARFMPKYCEATPAHEERTRMKIPLIENGCPVRFGVEILPSNDTQVKLMVPKIVFKGSRYSGVLVRCIIRPSLLNNPLNAFACSRELLHQSEERQNFVMPGAPIILK